MEKQISDVAAEPSGQKAVRAALRRKWKWSPWRIIPLPVLAYLVTATYWHYVGKSEAWIHGLGPVLTVSTFLIVGPVIRDWWFERERGKISVETKIEGARNDRAPEDDFSL